jgi:agmatine/peptidylarginine deiminase
MRVAAEWEPAVGVVIAWPLRLPPDLVVALAAEVDLYVTVNTERARARAARTFGEWGLDPARVHYVLTEQGTGYYLARDWGPFAVFDAAGKYRLVDGIFRDYPLSGILGNRIRFITSLVPLHYFRDDETPAALAHTMGVPRQELPISLTGGNVVFDGHGTGFATQLLQDENEAMGISKEQFLGLLRQHLGVQRFHFLPNFERLGIQHIDCLLKMLDEERILVKRVPETHPSYPHVENAVRALQKLTNVRGRPYEILRIDTAPYCLRQLAAYTNALIVNRKVFVPLFDIPADAAALETYRRALPGYEVRGYWHDGWVFTDALHCRVRAIWDPAMLYLSHARPPWVMPAGSLTLTVQIRDYSGAGLIPDRLALVWRPQASPSWHAAPLRAGAGVDTFEATLGDLHPGQVVEYYFSAASASGRQETMPRTAPQAMYSVTIGQPG